jgi:hypothetical protein
LLRVALNLVRVDGEAAETQVRDVAEVKEISKAEFFGSLNVSHIQRRRIDNTRRQRRQSVSPGPPRASIVNFFPDSVSQHSETIFTCLNKDEIVC